ncbi:MAG TPA: glycosyltransferase family 9 protein, partial [Bacteroidota bacterium]
LMDNPSATSTVICLLAGARWSVGLQKDNAYAYDVVVPLLSRKESHIIERIAQLLTPFGIDPAREDLRIRFTIPRGADEFATRAFSALGIKGRRTIGINISAGHAVRFWGRDNFCSLITLIQQHDRNVTVIVMSTPSQRVDAEDIARGFTKVFVPPPTHSFDEFAALIARCDMLITPDTSAVHLATAFGVPVLALYVQSNKNLRIWEPYKALSEVLVADVDDLRVISPLEVFKAFQRLQRAKLRKVPGKPLRTASPT